MIIKVATHAYGAYPIFCRKCRPWPYLPFC